MQTHEVLIGSQTDNSNEEAVTSRKTRLVKQEDSMAPSFENPSFEKLDPSDSRPINWRSYREVTNTLPM